MKKITLKWSFAHIDVNECATGFHECDVNAICTNTIGSYMCQCLTGFCGDGFKCTGMHI
jgi:hypothetical protein